EIEKKLYDTNSELRQLYYELAAKISELRSDNGLMVADLKNLLTIANEREMNEAKKFNSIIEKLNNLAFDKIQLRDWIFKNA
ncbi:hypothetical protein NL471_27215, partial [Klebsiella pneumoniae]|nr:hypothetical protein [Klebsiella pneumoniae]